MMTTIFPSTYAPPISYYIKLIQFENPSIELFETFPKQTIRNRCIIVGSNGPLRLTIPLSNRKNNLLMNEVEISYQTNWQIQHWRSLVSAYNASPFFEFYMDEFNQIYSNRFQFLWQWNKAVFDLINKFLKIDISYTFTKAYWHTEQVENDHRNYDFIKNNEIRINQYHQVFEQKYGFVGNLSILDLLFNCGNQSKGFLF